MEANGTKTKTDGAGRGNPALHNRKHLRRLGRVFETYPSPLYYLTICVKHRKHMLASPAIHDLLARTWREALEIHGWMVGRYVIMPDHVHFFATADAENAKDLSGFSGCWKSWTRKQLREAGWETFSWQRELFDRLLRNNESYSNKWDYVRMNPVREQLVEKPEDWPYQGEIHILQM
jgi:REP element-mobilizing transposase RayT